jgi:hypothetical protein
MPLHAANNRSAREHPRCVAPPTLGGMAADEQDELSFELDIEDAPGPPTPDEVLTFNAPANGARARDGHARRGLRPNLCI